MDWNLAYRAGPPHHIAEVPNAQVPDLLIYDETQYVVDRLDEVY